MADQHEDAQDAITADEMSGTAIPGRTSVPQNQGGRSANAFTQLMSPKAKSARTAPQPQKARPIVFSGRDGLGAYTADPTAFPPERVIYHDDDFVVINDLYPKSAVHTLVLPRNTERNILHPFDAFEDAAFLELVKKETANAERMVAAELRRRYSKFSASDKPRRQAMESEDPPDELPVGRDWSKDVMSGIHAHPSMNHVHVHVMSRDMYSECMKHRKHYESFNTPFLVPLEAFPLAKDDPRRHPGKSGYLDQDLKCWRCGKVFGNRHFSKLKAHLETEFEDWKRE